MKYFNLIIGFIIVILIILMGAKITQLRTERDEYKQLVEEIDKQPYWTDGYQMDANKCFEIHFNYELGENGWWEMYIDQDYSDENIKEICQRMESGYND